MCARTLDTDSQTAIVRHGDARDTLRELATQMRRAVLSVVWRQWRVLGAATVSAPPSARSSRARSDASGGARTLIDPEALVLVSLLLLDDERRLADLLRDWTILNSDLLSVQRVKNLAAQYPDQVQPTVDPRIAWFAGIAMTAGKDVRWRSLAPAGGGRTDAAGLGELTVSGGEFEPAALRSTGRARAPHASTKSRATRATNTDPVALLLRLRLGLGVGVKADVIAFLLGRVESWQTVREIAEATAYTSAAVRRAVDDLAAARFIESRDAQPASYRASAGAWGALLAVETPLPRWGSWQERFVFTSAMLQWERSSRDRPLSAYAFGVQGREMLQRHRVAFERDQIATWSAHTRVDDWGAFVQRTVRALAEWIEDEA